MVHYYDNIKNFGSPNGLCSSITESKHIVAVKRPWRRSSRYKALSQILKVNERLDKLAAARADFTTRGMLRDPPLVAAILGAGIDNDPSGHDKSTHQDDDHGDGGDEDNEDGIEDDDGGDGDDSDAGPVESGPLMNEVRLARDKGNYDLFCTLSTSYGPFAQPLPANMRQPLPPLE